MKTSKSLIFVCMAAILLLFTLPSVIACTDTDGDGFNLSETDCGTADCNDDDYTIIPLSNNYGINRSVMFCPGTYNLASGIRIIASNITIQCNSTTMNGSGTTGTGITVSARTNITISNCIVTRYSNGISLTGTNDSLINNNAVSYVASYGITLSTARNNIITNNTMNSDRGGGIYLSSSPNNTASYNTILATDQMGVYLYSSSNNTLSFNTVKYGASQAVYIRQGSNYNNLSNNIISSNRVGIEFLGSTNNNVTANMMTFNSQSIVSATGNNLQENILQDNLRTSTITDVLIRQNRSYSKDEQINLSFNFIYSNGSRVATLAHITSVYPSTNYSITVVLNQINISFIPNKTGEYTVSLNLTDDENNSEKKNYVFLIGNITYDSDRYYMHQNIPTHGQPVPGGTNTDVGSMFSYNTLSDMDGVDNEVRTCSAWVMYLPDEIANRYMFIKNVSLNLLYKTTGVTSVAFQKYATYTGGGDYTGSFPTTGGNFTFNTTVIPNIDFNLDYAWGFYWTSVKLSGSAPSIVSNATQQSYADFIYGYVGPRIIGFKAANNDTDMRKANILSSYFENDAKTNSTIQVGGEGNITVLVNMSVLGGQTVRYDGILCALNDNCTLNSAIANVVNVTLKLGSEHTLNIETGTDTTPPYFVQLLTNQTLTYGSALNYQINASDNAQFESYSINDTARFTINLTSGLLTNNTQLSAGTYELNITINDTANNQNSTIISVTANAAPVVVTTTYTGSGGGSNKVYTDYVAPEQVIMLPDTTIEEPIATPESSHASKEELQKSVQTTEEPKAEEEIKIVPIKFIFTISGVVLAVLLIIRYFLFIKKK